MTHIIFSRQGIHIVIRYVLFDYFFHVEVVHHSLANQSRYNTYKVSPDPYYYSHQNFTNPSISYSNLPYHRNQSYQSFEESFYLNDSNV